MRVETNLPNTSNNLSGVFFAKVADGSPDDWTEVQRRHLGLEPGDKKSGAYLDWDQERANLARNAHNPPPWFISESIDEATAKRFLAIPGFRTANRSEDELALADDGIAGFKVSSVARTPTGGSTAAQQIAELQAANLAQAADLSAAREEAETLRRELTRSKLPPTERVKELDVEVATLVGTIRELKGTIGRLETRNESLSNALDKKSPAAVAAAPQASAPEPARPARKRRRRKVRRASRPVAAAAPLAEAPAAV